MASRSTVYDEAYNYLAKAISRLDLCTYIKNSYRRRAGLAAGARALCVSKFPFSPEKVRANLREFSY